MKPENKQFFGEHGITSTQANFIANLAKESIQRLEAELNSVSFLTESVTLENGTTHILKKGISADELQVKLAYIIPVSEFSALIAWLREAIKAKTEEELVVSRLNTQHFEKATGMTIPKYNTYPEFNLEDAIGELSIKERNRYFTLETVCAKVGKFIHPTGVFSNAKKELFQKKDTTKLEEKKDNILIMKYESSIDSEIVEARYNELQNLHRQYNAELNGMKYKLQNRVIEEQKRYSIEAATQAEMYNKEYSAWSAAFQSWVKEKLQEVEKLKIIIPNELQSCFNTLNNKFE